MASTNTSGSPWIISNEPIVRSRLKMFCFPFAGGGASVLRDWAKLFPPEVQVCLVQYPGKESRMRETPYRQLMPLADSVVQGLLPYLHPPYVFFGYSMGAIVAFEVSQRLRRIAHPGPDMLIASASPSPHRRRKAKIKFNLPEPELINELRGLAGAPPQVLDNADLIQLFLPAIRADFEAIETYCYDGKHKPLACPIVAIGGSNDPDIEATELDEWQMQTARGFNRHMMAGSHFFLLDNPQAVADLVMSHLLQLTEKASFFMRSSELQPLATGQI